MRRLIVLRSTTPACARWLRAAALLAVLAAPLAADAQATVKRGDVNGDGAVDALDAQAVLAHVVGLTLPDSFVIGRGDANGDGIVGAVDAQIILAFAVGLNVSQFGVGEPLGEPVATVAVVPDAPILSVGLTLQLHAVLSDAAGEAIPRRVVAWTSLDPGLATSSPTGMLLGRAPGTARIVAVSEGVADTAVVTVGAAPMLAQADSTLLTRQLDVLRLTLNAAALDTVSRIVASAANDTLRLSAHLEGYFRTRGATRALRTALVDGRAVGYSAGLFDKLGRASVAAVRGSLLQLLEAHPTNLATTLAADPVLSTTFVELHALVADLLRLWGEGHPIIVGIRDLYQAELGTYPQYFAWSSTSTAAPVRTARFHALSGSVRAILQTGGTPSDAMRSAAIGGAAGGLFGDHSLIVVDDRYLDNAQLDVLRTFFSLVPRSMHNIGMVTVAEASSATGLLPAYLPGPARSTIDLWQYRVGIAGYTLFLPELPGIFLDAFLSSAISRTFFIAQDLLLAENTPLRQRRDALSAAAGSLEQNHVARLWYGGPTAYFVSGVLAWFTSAEASLRLGRVRYDAGIPLPLHQTLLIAEFFSEGGATTQLFQTTDFYRLARRTVPVARDANGHIVELPVGDSVYTFTRNVAGDVQAYTIRPRSSGAVSTLQLQVPSTLPRDVPLQLQASPRDADGAPIFNRAVTWTSSDPLIATVSTNGLARGMAVGSATLTATSEGVAASVVVEVTPLNLRIGRAYVTQATQRSDGSVPLIAGREALVRIFPFANQLNIALPEARLHVYHGGALTRTVELSARTTAVPVTIDESSGSASWNVRLPAEDVRSGLALVAEIDPANMVEESDEGDNRYPAGTGALTPPIVAVPPIGIRFIPVHLTFNGTTGIATPELAESFLSLTRRMHPLRDIEWDIRTPFTTSAWPWGNAISEIRALQIAEGTTRYYYGVVRPGGTGYSGLAYIGGRAGMGWDMAADDEGSTYAHELGHNLSLYHAPCGGATGTDPFYPYGGAAVGTTGWDWIEDRIIPSSHRDFMSYCGPEWISDHNYLLMMNYRGTSAAPTLIAAREPRPSLLLWGRINASEFVLEPAFDITAPAVLPEADGPFTLEGLDANGATVFSLRFTPTTVADIEGERHFAFGLPISESDRGRMARLRLRGDGRETELAIRGAGTPASAPTLRAEGSNTMVITWDATREPVLLVRDPVTREILSFARGGNARVRTNRSEVEVQASDGVRTRSAILRAAPR